VQKKTSISLSIANSSGMSLHFDYEGLE